MEKNKRNRESYEERKEVKRFMKENRWGREKEREWETQREKERELEAERERVRRKFIACSVS